MTAQPAVLVVGDGIIDQVERLDGEISVAPGGAALNVAVGARVLGVATTLIFTGAQDQQGAMIRSYLAAHDVPHQVVPSRHGTGVASSRPGSRHGTLVYSFNEAIRARRYAFDAAMRQLAERAQVIAVTGFPFDEPDSVAQYSRLVDGTEAIKVIDPNPRPAGMRSREGFRDGFLSIARTSDLVKVSDEDLELLFGDARDASRLAARQRPGGPGDPRQRWGVGASGGWPGAALSDRSAVDPDSGHPRCRRRDLGGRVVRPGEQGVDADLRRMAGHPQAGHGGGCRDLPVAGWAAEVAR
ncbi:MAG: PfkB family carbohydrate kinase [Propionicimonas sp.]